MGRLGALLNVMLAFVGFVAAPVEAAARRHRLQLVEDSIRQSEFGGTKKRAFGQFVSGF